MSREERSEPVNIDPEADIRDLFNRKKRCELYMKRFVRRMRREKFYANVRARFSACRRWFRYD